jgi:hypothetical protein
MYSQQGNHGQMFHLQTKSDSLVQGGMSMTDYFSELNNMWGQMDFFNPLTMKCIIDALSFENWLNKRRIFRFLDGLNPEFDSICQNL